MRTGIALGLGLGLASSTDAASWTVTELSAVHTEVTGCIMPAGVCFDYELKTIATNLNSVDLCSTRPSTQWIAPIGSASALGDAAAAQLSVVPTTVPQMFLARVAPGTKVTSTKMSTLRINVKVEGYFRCPNEYLVLYGTEETVQAAMNDSIFSFAPAKPLAFPDVWKIAPDLNTNFKPEGVLVNEDEEVEVEEAVEVQIQIATGSNAAAMAASLKEKLVNSRATRRRLQGGEDNSANIEVKETSLDVLTATGLELRDELLQGGAALELAGVKFISRKGRYTTENFDATLYAQSGTSLQQGDLPRLTPANSPFYAAGITGTGQVVGVSDSGLDYNHCMFKDQNVDVVPVQGEAANSLNHRKILQYWSYLDDKEGSTSGHGTHVCGTVAGDTGETVKRGIAYGAKLSFFDIGKAGTRELEVPDNMAEVFDPAKSVGAYIHTNSWGDPNATAGYDLTARSVDEYLWNNQDFLALFAAGNGGYSSSGTSYSPGSAKNVMTVGAQVSSDRAWAATGDRCPAQGSTECTNNVAYFSSIGPTFDSRIKPDILAIGNSVYSARSDARGADSCLFTQKSGTSMASPAAAGAAALVRQYLVEGFYPTGSKVSANSLKPMGALIKAVLINSGDALTGRYANNRNLGSSPSFLQGHGAINLSNTLKTDSAGANTYLDGSYPNMPELNEEQQIEYKVTVASSSGSLKVTLVYHDPPAALQASIALINDLDVTVTKPSGEVVYANNKNGFDRLNNVEQVVILGNQLPAGEYIVRITVHAMPEGPQPYALVVTGGESVTKGTVTGTNPPAPSPATPRPVEVTVCKTLPAGWYDADGPDYNCAWYAVAARCAEYGTGYANRDGVTANMACCVCGGGTEPTGQRDTFVAQKKSGADLVEEAETAAAPSGIAAIAGAAGAGLAVGAIAAMAVVYGMKRNSARTAEVGFDAPAPVSKSIASGHPSFQDL